MIEPTPHPRGDTAYRGPAMDWIKIYDLSEDHRHIEAVQRATEDAGPFGLKPEPALFGSSEWWRAVESGVLPKHWVTGVIQTPLWTGMGDFPEVDVADGSGAVSRWVRHGDVTQYAKGRGIRLCWVMQHSKTDMAQLGPDQEVVLEVWLEGGNWRATAEEGPGPGRSLDDGWEGGRG